MNGSASVMLVSLEQNQIIMGVPTEERMEHLSNKVLSLESYDVDTDSFILANQWKRLKDVQCLYNIEPRWMYQYWRLWSIVVVPPKWRDHKSKETFIPFSTEFNVPECFLGSPLSEKDKSDSIERDSHIEVYRRWRSWHYYRKTQDPWHDIHLTLSTWSTKNLSVPFYHEQAIFTKQDNAHRSLSGSTMDDAVMCRICNDLDGPFVRPCKCRGSIAFVHIQCLQRWIKSPHARLHCYHCELCGEQYNIEFRYEIHSRFVKFLMMKIASPWLENVTEKVKGIPLSMYFIFLLLGFAITLLILGIILLY